MTGTPWDLFVYFLRLSLLAVGGANAAVPEMHRGVVEIRGWMTDEVFAQGYALAASSPGPNVLFVAVIGWHVAGAAGLAASLGGFLGPTFLLAWAVAMLTQRLAGAPWLAALRAGLVPVAIGLTLATGIVTGAAAAHGTAAEVATALLITAAAALFVWRSRLSPIWALLAGGVVGLLLLR